MIENGLFVVEIFDSVQGEGPKLGMPSIFLRLGICNLHCIWCDTTYTWKKGETDYTKCSLTRVLRKIRALRKKIKTKNLVITGGEPLLQQKALTQLLSDKSLKDMEIEFETNGSTPLLPAFKKLMDKRIINFNVSPKLADSGNKPHQVHIYPKAILKFVYVNKKSEQLIDDFLAGRNFSFKHKNSQVPVYIMPEGISVKAMRQKYQNILRYCKRRGFIFTPRLHIYLFGNKRAT